MPWMSELFSGVTFFVEDESKRPKCVICDADLIGLEWTIVHGVAICRCGAQYQTLQYEGGRLLDKEPLCLVQEELIPKYREAWMSSKSREEYFEKAKKVTDEFDEKEEKL